MDEMKWWELDILMNNNLLLATKQELERTRLIMFAAERQLLKRWARPTDVLKLPWDIDTNKEKITTNVEMTDNDIENLRKLYSKRNKGDA